MTASSGRDFSGSFCPFRLFWDMKRLLCALTLLAVWFGAAAQGSPLETGRTFLRSGDYDNAILVFSRGLQQDQNNIELQKELAMALFLKRDFSRATELLNTLLDHPEADAPSFQIAGNIYKAMERVKDAEKVYKQGLRRYPKSGPLYSEYGELLFARNDYSAISQWEKGIREDPSYAGNYYNAARFYYYTKDKTWTLLYGEIFVNMESLSERGTAMRELLLATYKEKLFVDVDMLKDQPKNLTPFMKAYLETMGTHASVVSRGINVDVLIMLRTRFLLDWMKQHAGRFPFRLFDYHQQLLREGMFEAYNQWLFGAAENLPVFENWSRTHAEEYERFSRFQKGRVFRMPAGQYYGN